MVFIIRQFVFLSWFWIKWIEFLFSNMSYWLYYIISSNIYIYINKSSIVFIFQMIYMSLTLWFRKTFVCFNVYEVMQRIKVKRGKQIKTKKHALLNIVSNIKEKIYSSFSKPQELALVLTLVLRVFLNYTLFNRFFLFHSVFS